MIAGRRETRRFRSARRSIAAQKFDEETNGRCRTSETDGQSGVDSLAGNLMRELELFIDRAELGIVF